MRRIITIVLALALVFTTAAYAFASDWDVAGKVLAGIEGLRILSGGKVDIIGNIAGVNKDGRGERRHDHYGYSERCRRIWIPNFAWEKKWIPDHTEHDARYGEIFVEGHYIRYKVERGGRWDYDCAKRIRD